MIRKGRGKFMHAHTGIFQADQAWSKELCVVWLRRVRTYQTYQ